MILKPDSCAVVGAMYLLEVKSLGTERRGFYAGSMWMLKDINSRARGIALFLEYSKFTMHVY